MTEENIKLAKKFGIDVVLDLSNYQFVKKNKNLIPYFFAKKNSLLPIEERKKDFSRSLKKDEKMILNIINREKELLFEDLLNLTNKKTSEVDSILEILSLQSKIRIKRELVEASWTKRILAIENIDIDVKEIKIDKEKKDFILDIFSYQPCLICPFASKCNETNLDQFNPHHCQWLTEWINDSLEGKIYHTNFDDVQTEN